MGSQDLKLYEYPEVIDSIVSAAEDGELSAEQVAELDRLLGDLRQKVRSVHGAIVHYAGLAERAKEERDRLAVLQKSLEARVDNLRLYLIRCMRHEDVRKVVTEVGTFSLAKNSRPKIRWAWGDKPIPAEYARTRIVVELDARKALEAYQAGVLPDGFDVELGESLRIR